MDNFKSPVPVTLNGALRVDLVNGFSPALNDSLTLLTGTHNCTFANFVYRSNVVTMQLSNTASSVMVRVSGIAVPAPVLFATLLSGSNVVLSWTAVSKIYRLEFNPDPTLTNCGFVPGDVTALRDRAGKLDLLSASNHAALCTRYGRRPEP